MSLNPATKLLHNDMFFFSRGQYHSLSDPQSGLKLIPYDFDPVDEQLFSPKDFSDYLGRKVCKLSPKEFDKIFPKISNKIHALDFHNGIISFLSSYIKEKKLYTKNEKLQKKDSSLDEAIFTVKCLKNWANFKGNDISKQFFISSKEWKALKKHDSHLPTQTVEKVMNTFCKFSFLLGASWAPFVYSLEDLEKASFTKKLFKIYLPLSASTILFSMVSPLISRAFLKYRNKKACLKADAITAKSSVENKQALMSYLLRAATLFSLKQEKEKENYIDYMKRIENILTR